MNLTAATTKTSERSEAQRIITCGTTLGVRLVSAGLREWSDGLLGSLVEPTELTLPVSVWSAYANVKVLRWKCPHRTKEKRVLFDAFHLFYSPRYTIGDGGATRAATNVGPWAIQPAQHSHNTSTHTVRKKAMCQWLSWPRFFSPSPALSPVDLSHKVPHRPFIRAMHIPACWLYWSASRSFVPIRPFSPTNTILISHSIQLVWPVFLDAPVCHFLPVMQSTVIHMAAPDSCSCRPCSQR